MAVYTDITDQELAELLEAYDLGEAVSFKGVAEGVENSNFLLETDKGRYFLTVYERRVRPEDLPFFLGLMTWLAEHGFPCARPVADREGHELQSVRGKPCAIVEFLPGLSVRRPSVAQCRAAGEGLARLHLAADGFPQRRENDLGAAVRPTARRRRGPQARSRRRHRGRPRQIHRRLAQGPAFRRHPRRLLPGQRLLPPRGGVRRRHRLLLRLR
jgi:homoserine kinase